MTPCARLAWIRERPSTIVTQYQDLCSKSFDQKYFRCVEARAIARNRGESVHPVHEGSRSRPC